MSTWAAQFEVRISPKIRTMGGEQYSLNDAVWNTNEQTKERTVQAFLRVSDEGAVQPSHVRSLLCADCACRCPAVQQSHPSSSHELWLKSAGEEEDAVPAFPEGTGVADTAVGWDP
jgi:hypothetical protein